MDHDETIRVRALLSVASHGLLNASVAAQTNDAEAEAVLGWLKIVETQLAEVRQTLARDIFCKKEREAV